LPAHAGKPFVSLMYEADMCGVFPGGKKGDHLKSSGRALRFARSKTTKACDAKQQHLPADNPELSGVYHTCKDNGKTTSV
jgi:hypothetical protein